MRKPFLLIFVFFLSLQSHAQSSVEIVEEFNRAYNQKDSLKTFGVLHQDFAEFWMNDTIIRTKVDYANNYAWGKVMNDREEIEIVHSDSLKVETQSTYYSDRDSLLGIGPYRSKRTYIIRNGQIVKILGGKFGGYQAYDQPRRAAYKLFFDWLSERHALQVVDFPFDKKSAERLKLYIVEYRED